MELVSAVLRERRKRYADTRGLTLQSDEQFHVGSGQDGSVFATSRNTAVKVFKYEQPFEEQWPQVRAIRAALRCYGICLTDLSPNNIALVP